MTTHEDAAWRYYHFKGCAQGLDGGCKICKLIEEHNQKDPPIPWWFNGLSGMIVGGLAASAGYLLAKWLFG